MAGRLIESLATTDALAELFSDASVLQAMLDFEVGLARAEAKVGLVPSAAADAIAAVAKPELFDAAKLAKDALLAGALPIPLVKALTESVRAKDSAAAGFVHWGATSQDVADTALVLLLKRARPLLESDLARLENAFAAARRDPREYCDAGAHSVASSAADNVRTQGRGLAGLDSSLQSEAHICIC